MSETDLREAARMVDEETKTALTRALREDPALIESTLRDYGYLNDEATHPRNDDAVASLTDSEQRLYKIVSDLSAPGSISRVIDVINEEYPEFGEDYGSYDERSWLNRKLNTLAENGLIGKFRDGRTVVYTAEVSEAVRHWALHNNRFVDELSSQDVDEIVTDTGMAKSEVARAVTELRE